MNVSVLLPFPPSPVYYSYSSSGVEWSQRTIGDDGMLVGGARYDARLKSVDSHKIGLLVRTFGKFSPVGSSGFLRWTFYSV
jgi:hypothetical protein